MNAFARSGKIATSVLLMLAAFGMTVSAAPGPELPGAVRDALAQAEASPSPSTVADLCLAWSPDGDADSLEALLRDRADDANPRRAVVLGYYLELSGKPREACGQYRRAIAADAACADAHAALGIVLAEALDVGNAEPALLEAAKGDLPPDVRRDLVVETGRLFLRTDRRQEAAALWQQAARDAKAARERSAWIDRLACSGLVDEAAELLQSLLQDEGDPAATAELAARLGSLRMASGAADEASDAFIQALETCTRLRLLEPWENVLAHLEYACTGPCEPASRKLLSDRLRSEQGVAVGTLLALAHAHASAGETAEAAGLCRLAVAPDHTPAELLQQAESILRTVGEYGPAADMAVRIARLPDAGPADLRRAAVALARADRAPEAVSLAKEGLAGADGLPETFLNAARTLTFIGRADEAAAVLEAGLASHPDEPGLLRAALILSTHLGDRDRTRALAEVLAPTAAAPDVVAAAGCLTDAGDDEEALRLLRSRRDDFTDDPLFLGAFRAALITNGQSEEALPIAVRELGCLTNPTHFDMVCEVFDTLTAGAEEGLATRLAGKDDRSAGESLALARLRDRAGRTAEALALLETVQKANPSCAAAALALAQLARKTGDLDLLQRSLEAAVRSGADPDGSLAGRFAGIAAVKAGAGPEADAAIAEAVDALGGDGPRRALLTDNLRASLPLREAASVFLAKSRTAVPDSEALLQRVLRESRGAGDGIAAVQLVRSIASEKNPRTAAERLTGSWRLDTPGIARRMQGADPETPSETITLALLCEHAGDFAGKAAFLGQAARDGRDREDVRALVAELAATGGARSFVGRGFAQEFAIPSSGPIQGMMVSSPSTLGQRLPPPEDPAALDPKAAESLAGSFYGAMRTDEAARTVLSALLAAPDETRLLFLDGLLADETGNSELAARRAYRLLDAVPLNAGCRQDDAGPGYASFHRSAGIDLGGSFPPGAVFALKLGAAEGQVTMHRSSRGHRAYGFARSASGFALPENPESLRALCSARLLGTAPNVDWRGEALAQRWKARGGPLPGVLLDAPPGRLRDVTKRVQSPPRDADSAALRVLASVDAGVNPDGLPEAYRLLTPFYPAPAALAAVALAASGSADVPLDEALDAWVRNAPLDGVNLAGPMMGSAVDRLLRKSTREQGAWAVKVLRAMLACEAATGVRLHAERFFLSLALAEHGDDPAALAAVIDQAAGNDRPAGLMRSGGDSFFPAMAAPSVPPVNMPVFAGMPTLGRISVLAGQPEPGMGKLEAAIPLVKDKAVRLLLYHACGKPDAALTVAREIPADPEATALALCTAAGLFAQRGQPGEAVEALLRARERGEHPEAAWDRTFDASIVAVAGAAGDVPEDARRAGREALARLVTAVGPMPAMKRALLAFSGRLGADAEERLLQAVGAEAEVPGPVQVQSVAQGRDPGSLFREGKREEGVKEAAVRYKAVVRAAPPGTPEFSNYLGECRQIVQAVRQNGAEDDWLAALRPERDDARPEDWWVYAVACDACDRPADALAACRAMLKLKPGDLRPSVLASVCLGDDAEAARGFLEGIGRFSADTAADVVLPGLSRGMADWQDRRNWEQRLPRLEALVALAEHAPDNDSAYLWFRVVADDLLFNSCSVLDQWMPGLFNQPDGETRTQEMPRATREAMDQRKDLFLRLCRAGLRNPRTACEAFSRLELVADTMETDPAELYGWAVIAFTAATDPRQNRAATEPPRQWVSRSGSYVRLRGPEERLLEVATREGKTEDLDNARARADAGRATPSGERFIALKALYDADDGTFGKVLEDSLPEAPRVFGSVWMAWDAALDARKASQKTVDVTPLFLETLSRESSRGQPPDQGLAARFAADIAESEGADEAIAFLNAARDAMLTDVQKQFLSGEREFGSTEEMNRFQSETQGKLAALCVAAAALARKPETAFRAVDFAYGLTTSNEQVSGWLSQVATAFAETASNNPGIVKGSPFLAEWPAFRTYEPLADNQRGPFLTLCMSLSGDKAAAMAAAAEGTTPPTFGSRLLPLALRARSEAVGNDIWNLLGEYGRPIAEGPELPRAELANWLGALARSDAGRFTLTPAGEGVTPEAKELAAALAEKRADAVAAEADAFLGKTASQDVYSDLREAGKLLARLADADPKTANAVLRHALTLLEQSPVMQQPGQQRQAVSLFLSYSNSHSLFNTSPAALGMLLKEATDRGESQSIRNLVNQAQNLWNNRFYAHRNAVQREISDYREQGLAALKKTVQLLGTEDLDPTGTLWLDGICNQLNGFEPAQIEDFGKWLAADETMGKASRDSARAVTRLLLELRTDMDAARGMPFVPGKGFVAAFEDTLTDDSRPAATRCTVVASALGRSGGRLGRRLGDFHSIAGAKALLEIPADRPWQPEELQILLAPVVAGETTPEELPVVAAILRSWEERMALDQPGPSQDRDASRLFAELYYLAGENETGDGLVTAADAGLATDAGTILMLFRRGRTEVCRRLLAAGLRSPDLAGSITNPACRVTTAERAAFREQIAGAMPDETAALLARAMTEALPWDTRETDADAEERARQGGQWAEERDRVAATCAETAFPERADLLAALRFLTRFPSPQTGVDAVLAKAFDGLTFENLIAQAVTVPADSQLLDSYFAATLASGSTGRYVELAEQARKAPPAPNNAQVAHLHLLLFSAFEKTLLQDNTVVKGTPAEWLKAEQAAHALFVGSFQTLGRQGHGLYRFIPAAIAVCDLAEKPDVFREQMAVREIEEKARQRRGQVNAYELAGAYASFLPPDADEEAAGKILARFATVHLRPEFAEFLNMDSTAAFVEAMVQKQPFSRDREKWLAKSRALLEADPAIHRKAAEAFLAVESIDRNRFWQEIRRGFGLADPLVKTDRELAGRVVDHAISLLDGMAAEADTNNRRMYSLENIFGNMYRELQQNPALVGMLYGHAVTRGDLNAVNRLRQSQNQYLNTVANELDKDLRETITDHRERSEEVLRRLVAQFAETYGKEPLPPIPLPDYFRYRLYSIPEERRDAMALWLAEQKELPALFREVLTVWLHGAGRQRRPGPEGLPDLPLDPLIGVLRNNTLPALHRLLPVLDMFRYMPDDPRLEPLIAPSVEVLATLAPQGRMEAGYIFPPVRGFLELPETEAWQATARTLLDTTGGLWEGLEAALQHDRLDASRWFLTRAALLHRLGRSEEAMAIVDEPRFNLATLPGLYAMLLARGEAGSAVRLFEAHAREIQMPQGRMDGYPLVPEAVAALPEAAKAIPDPDKNLFFRLITLSADPRVYGVDPGDAAAAKAVADSEFGAALAEAVDHEFADPEFEMRVVLLLYTQYRNDRERLDLIGRVTRRCFDKIPFGELAKRATGNEGSFANLYQRVYLRALLRDGDVAAYTRIAKEAAEVPANQRVNGPLGQFTNSITGTLGEVMFMQGSDEHVGAASAEEWAELEDALWELALTSGQPLTSNHYNRNLVSLCMLVSEMLDKPERFAARMADPKVAPLARQNQGRMDLRALSACFAGLVRGSKDADAETMLMRYIRLGDREEYGAYMRRNADAPELVLQLVKYPPYSDDPGQWLLGATIYFLERDDKDAAIKVAKQIKNSPYMEAAQELLRELGAAPE